MAFCYQRLAIGSVVLTKWVGAQLLGLKGKKKETPKCQSRSKQTKRPSGKLHGFTGAPDGDLASGRAGFSLGLPDRPLLSPYPAGVTSSVDLQVSPK